MRKKASFVALCPLLVFPVGGAWALGLGEIQPKSALGERLVATIEVVGGESPSIDPSCFRLQIPPPGAADEIPTLRQGRVTLQRRGNDYQLRVTSDRPVNEPILQVGIEIGCGAELARRFTLLLSPPDVSVPTVAADSSAASVAPAEVARAPKASRGERRGVSGKSTKRTSKRHIPGRSGAAVPLSTAPAGAEPVRSAAAPGAPAADRLVIAAGTGAIGAAGAESDEAKIKRKLDETGADVTRLKDHLAANFQTGGDPALEKSLSELQSRLAAVQQSLAAMQAQASGAVAAAPPAQTPAPSPEVTPPTAQAQAPAAGQAGKEPPAEGGWPAWLLPLLLALLGIGGGVLLAYRNRGRRVEGGNEGASEEAPAWRMPLLTRGTAAAGAQFETPTVGSSMPLEQASWPTTKGGGIPSAMRSVKLEDVSEADSIMELAELLVSYGRLKSAAEALQEFINAKPKEALQPWVRLLDIYRRMGRREEFEQLATDLNRNFNVERVVWGEDSHAIVEALTEEPARGNRPLTLEGFPHIMERIVSSWGSRECLAFLQDLLHDNREGSREGFSLPVIQEIVLLAGMLERQLGPLPKPELS